MTLGHGSSHGVPNAPGCGSTAPGRPGPPKVFEADLLKIHLGAFGIGTDAYTVQTGLKTIDLRIDHVEAAMKPGDTGRIAEARRTGPTTG